MRRKIFAGLLMALVASAAQAQDGKWYENIKLSGYGMLQYQASDKKNAEENSFKLRILRLSLDGKISDFAWKVQAQGNSNSSASGTSFNIVDLFGEWQRYSFFRVKAGQFKRPFTFENPMHPITQGFYSYAQSVLKLSGFSDRTGEQASNGRDIGLQVQGDLLKLGGRPWVHYQVGVFNGQGINVADVDNRKDIIGGLWLMPLKGMRIGAFGWTGSRGVKDAAGNVKSLNKNRYALSAEYDRSDWTFRTEYIHSQGRDVAGTKGDRADGFYALGIVPLKKEKMHVKARYDLYRDEAAWASSKTYYEVGVDYLFTKNLQLNLEYARVNERIGHNNYNMVDVELDVRF